MKLLCVNVNIPGRLDDYFINIMIGKVYDGEEYGEFISMIFAA